ncbi:(2Fe-2S)-binding protein [Nonomuraea longicatena]|uniref:Ferric siderophore reductase C-terminal domain-containing protein n=1 Tax=Nonomuraea longicatena TaxID=83682 RepID=A0ABN1Q4B8_9ACTN
MRYDLVPAPESTVRAALDGVASFAPHVGGDPAGWHDVRTDYERGFTDLVTATAERYGTGELRVGASIAQLGHAARLWFPVVGAVLVHGVIPDLTRLDRADDGPRVRLSVVSGWHAGTEEQVAGLLYDMVVGDHLDALARGLRVKVAHGLLYGNAASALAEAGRAVVSARPDLAEPATRLVDRLLGHGGLAGRGALVSPELAFRRTTCCLYYRVPDGGKCGDCALGT